MRRGRRSAPTTSGGHGSTVIAHILKTIPYKKISRDKIKLPKRSHKGRYNDQASLRGMKFVAERY